MSATIKHPEFVIIGRITKPHGVRGALKVEPITDDPSRFQDLERIYLGPEDEPGDTVDITSVQFQNKTIVLGLKGVDSRDDADKFRGLYVYVPFSEAIDIPEDSVFLFELIGLKVYTNNNEFVGSVKDVQEFPASNMFVVEQGEKEFLIPDVPDIVLDVDLENEKITINPIDGLLDSL